MLFTFTIEENNETLFEIPFVMDSKTEVIETVNSIYSELNIKTTKEKSFKVHFAVDQDLFITKNINNINVIQSFKNEFVMAIENKKKEYNLNSNKDEN